MTTTTRSATRLPDRETRRAKAGTETKAPSTPPEPEGTEKPKEKEWLSLKNEVLWSQVWSVGR
ncbi:MAG TPA: hypothetical protein VGG61_03565 [Gemmataceae bacterium]